MLADPTSTHGARPATSAAPLLTGATLATARASLAELSAALRRVRPSTLDLSLGKGACGLALAHAALDAALPGEGHAARAQRFLDRAIAQLGNEMLEPGLHDGLAGVGWLAARLDGARHAAVFASIDRALGEAVADASWNGRFDVARGLAGIGVYALERLPDPAARALVGAVVARLAANARCFDAGIAWWSDPLWISPDRSVPRPPLRELVLGAAHGTAGVIALLGRVVGCDVDARTRDKARALLAPAVAWLLAQELPKSAAGCFAEFAVPSFIARQPARTAWCVGDVGIAAALLVAARGARDDAWERAAVRIALRAAERPEDRTGIVDTGLCHGAFGVAHAFHRWFLTTHDERFALVARRWFARGLAMRTPGSGIAGFRSFELDRRQRETWRSTPGFLSGAAGIALALVAATTNVEPSWDRALLLS